MAAIARKLMRTFLIALNILIGLLAVVILVSGALALTRDISGFKEFGVGSGTITSTSWTTVLTGQLMALVAILGCFGAWKEKKIFLIIYSAFMIAVLLVVTAVAAILVVHRTTMVEGVRANLRQSLLAYVEGEASTNDATRKWDNLQRSGDCCGINEYNDWWENEHYSASGRRFPQTCCKPEASNCDPANPTPGSFHVRGCFQLLGGISNLIGVMGYASVGLSMVLGVAVLSAIYIACTIVPADEQEDDDDAA